MEKPRKSFKDRLSKFLLRSACSTTTTSTTRPFKRLPKNPQPDSKLNPKTTGKLDRHLSFPSHSDRPVIQITIDCASRHSVDAAQPTAKCKKKKERRLTENGSLYETGDCEGRKCPPASPHSPSNCLQYQCLSKSERKDKEIQKKLFYNGNTFTSSSSVGSENEPESFFVSEREKQELISSRSFSFSSESSELYRRKSSFMRENRCTEERIEEVEEESGFAVVKQSVDPYKDFRNSMVEMILERRIKGADDMRKLLESYLELNSPEHHPIIVSAFADVWDAIFPKS